MNKPLVAMILGLLLGLGAALPAHAEDFTFIVPLRLSNLPPEITHYQVGCGVNASGASGSGYGPRIGGTTSGERPITGGAFSGDVTIAFNALPTADPRSASLWGCELRLIGTVAGVRLEFAPIAGGYLESIGTRSGPPVLIPSGSKTNTVNVSGTLPRK